MKVLALAATDDEAEALAAIAVGADVDVVHYVVPLWSENAAVEVAAQVAAHAPDVVMTSSDATARVLLGAAAAALEAEAFAHVVAVRETSAGVLIDRLTHGGQQRQTVLVPAGTTAAVSVHHDVTGVFNLAPEAEAVPGAVTVVDWTPGGEPLTAARRVVALGSGVADQAGLDLAQTLANALDAGVACTRPVALAGLLPTSRYIGTSGLSLAPDLYVAAGISGQWQHLTGVRDAAVIVAINTDPQAPIMRHSDVIIPVDAYAFVPALIEELDAE